MRHLIHTLSVAASMALFSSGPAITLAAEADINCGKPDKVCRQADTFLPLRALPRPFSNIYQGPTTGKVAFSNVKAFFPVYVFDKKDVDYSDPANPKGWYKIGPSVSDPMGWMEAKDIMEWKQALVVSYTHPGTGEERRQPVLMYENLGDLKALVESDKRTEQAKTAYEGMAKTPMTVPKGVVSMEPKRFVDIEKKEGFYILPVLDYEVLDIFDDETRYLQIAAAIPRDRTDTAGADLLQNQDYVEQATQSETTEGTQAQNLGVDIKFVMDITGSMGPYIDATKDAIRQIATQVVSKIDTHLHFGLIGYMDDTRDLTPELVDGNGFVNVISNVMARGGGDYQEEVFAGVKQGIESAWSENSIKVMVVVGDASSHPKGHPKNLTNMNAAQLQELASNHKIAIMAVHIKNRRAKRDHPIAKEQFSTLARNSASPEVSYYFPIDADNIDAFGGVIKTLSETLSKVIADVRSTKSGDKIDVIETTAEVSDLDTIDSSGEAEEAAAAFAKSLAATALVEYLGSAAKPPRDVTAWVLDRDFTDPDKRALDVRLLIKKSELNDLITALEQVLMAIKRSELTSMQFFDALQGVVTAAGKGEDISFKGAKRLKNSGLLPAWISSLPYKSAILELDDEMFESLSPDERGTLEDDIDAKLQYYREINESDLWVSLDDRDRNDANVYPINLEMLP
ncbi:MAG TPA: VWA domain-containing protein [Gammaproteobacteria bacterium]|nr:VWA domain-containing protein [Gammaproteobacteria bacterium]